MTARHDKAAAIAAGYTEEYFAVGDRDELHLLVRPESDLDGAFRAFCCGEHEYLNVCGWAFSFEPVQANA